MVYGPPPAAASGGSVAPGSVIYGPPPVGAQVVYGPLPPNFTVPLIPVGVLHCNVPEHHDLVRYRAVSCTFNHRQLTYEWIRSIFNICLLKKENSKIKTSFSQIRLVQFKKKKKKSLS